MQIYDKPLGWLTPYENNPRNNDEAVEPVANSISEFGFKVPIVATSDGEIINGHTRWKAAKKLKLKTVPVIIADDLTEELDSFNGGGSTLMVCEKTERIYYGMELDPVYVERTIKRWEEETGLKAEKIN